MAAAGACHGPGSRLQYRSQLHAPEAHLLFHVKGEDIRVENQQPLYAIAFRIEDLLYQTV
ncbi:hypothetical protein WN48_04768 [Eufriesea mexicana]|uniref:Uncharacterized protein n=1 Tax=Eufriesea mexicana TaxID=516756 RepID=A0A310SE41_9HYME|nr:hypothetical protein WN48_04768 [Eufriesea mexicana]